MAENDKLARDIFGGSDSELSSDEGDLTPQDLYLHKPAKPQKKRKRAAKKKEKEVEEPAPKNRLDQQIEAILKPKKSSRPKKRKNADEVLDSFADDQVARLRESMIMAADEDSRANDARLPATAKLRALSDAMDTLRKASLAESIIDNNLLEAVKKWLEPLPDRSLPSLNIQRELFGALRKMEFIDSSVLKEAKLGPVVLFYTKCKRVTPDVAKIANELVSTWSRPIIKRSASFRDRQIPIAALDDDASPAPGASQRPDSLNAILARAREEEKGRVKRNAVMIPQASFGTYTVAPKANAGVMRRGGPGRGVEMDTERRRKNAERLRMLTRKVKERG